MNYYFAGGEAQAYVGNCSLYGQAAYEHRDFDGSPAQGWAARVRVRYFVTPDWFIEGDAMRDVLNNTTFNYSISEDTFGLGTEYHPTGSRFGAFVNYTYSHLNAGGGNGPNTNRIVGGFRWYFDSQPLWGRETGGASLDPFLPSYQPWLPVG